MYNEHELHTFLLIKSTEKKKSRENYHLWYVRELYFNFSLNKSIKGSKKSILCGVIMPKIQSYINWLHKR